MSDTQEVSVREIAPGIFHWSALHPIIRVRVSSYYLAEARTVLDPLVPAEGLGLFDEREPPLRVLLTNRLHCRHTHRFVEAFGCEVWTNREGLSHFGPEGEIQGLDVRGFEAGESLPGGLESLAVGVLCPDETAFRIPGREPALAIADGVIRDGDGPLAFVPDALLGDDPEAVKRGLCAAYARLLPLEFDHLLLAHGDPWIGGGREALRNFSGTPSASAP
ncbi:MAG: hypothetical protein VX466_09330 [Myxococcota bacterium]|nr:hypothetical protein [Myxococcota bacterium]MEE2673986.1 hypothetical protein [Myxococcota bacterium]